MEELQSIKEEVMSLRNEFSRFLQRANQLHIEIILGEMKKNFMKPMVDYLSEDASERIHSQKAKDCRMRAFCEKAFLDILQETSGFICRDRIESETLKLYRKARGVKN
jgi:hypothetical protein